jgi:hypothetical protein
MPWQAVSWWILIPTWDDVLTYSNHIVGRRRRVNALCSQCLGDSCQFTRLCVTQHHHQQNNGSLGRLLVGPSGCSSGVLSQIYGGIKSSAVETCQCGFWQIVEHHSWVARVNEPFLMLWISARDLRWEPTLCSCVPTHYLHTTTNWTLPWNAMCSQICCELRWAWRTLTYWSPSLMTPLYKASCIHHFHLITGQLAVLEPWAVKTIVPWHTIMICWNNNLLWWWPRGSESLVCHKTYCYVRVFIWICRWLDII